MTTTHASDDVHSLEEPSTAHGLPDPADLLLVVICVAFGLIGLRPLSDPDVWWHLRTGDYVVHHGFTSTDPWSPASTEPWRLHEWGSQVLMYLSYGLGGYRGVVALHALGMLVLALLVARSVRRTTTPVVACAVTALSLVGLFLGTAERPQLMSWVLLAATLPALRRAIAARRPPWWFIPVVWLWANLHGLWSAGLLLYAALVVGLAFEVGLRSWRVYGPFLVVALSAFLAAGFTPVGPSLLLSPLQVRAYAGYVQEWAAPSILNHYLAPGFILLGIVVVGWARQRRPVGSTTIALVLVASYIGFSYIRTIPVAVIVFAPLVGEAWSGRDRDKAGLPMPVGVGWTSALGALAAFTLAAALVLPQIPGVERGSPWGVSKRLDALPGRALVLNEYYFGGWLLWSARDTAPGIDGRTEIYAPQYVGDYLAAESLKGHWRQFVKDHDFDAAWLRTSTPLVWGLRSMGWTTVYRNGYSVIMVPPRVPS
jgi:hypothetical protein